MIFYDTSLLIILPQKATCPFNEQYWSYDLFGWIDQIKDPFLGPKSYQKSEWKNSFFVDVFIMNNLNKIEKLEDIAGSLEELWVSYNQINSLDGLSACTNLTTLYISNNLIKSWNELDKLVSAISFLLFRAYLIF